MSHIYKQTENWYDEDGTHIELFTVGFYGEDGGWNSIADYGTQDEAAESCRRQREMGRE